MSDVPITITLPDNIEAVKEIHNKSHLARQIIELNEDLPVDYESIAGQTLTATYGELGLVQQLATQEPVEVELTGTYNPE